MKKLMLTYAVTALCICIGLIGIVVTSSRSDIRHLRPLIIRRESTSVDCSNDVDKTSYGTKSLRNRSVGNLPSKPIQR